ncbi:MAG: NADH-quinone oxidoreductase subunit H [Candidatus Obscuribacterales bacterium]|uniref:NADH-quinone oxidoreductase subunit H n=1 Tax=Candidatus Obscuribacter phosphatis TaxID=1906157 RepID=A0A8J7PFB1_9BACT|nr:NADH-quinone oxidoreductase subunit H [Candidatus Obscuribacter phosphatis]MBX9937763.1 NADH-quinone oxidoreductase subunit H [Candidatus Obscuribacterales bacterium]
MISNGAEIGKLTLLSVVWLTIVFTAVWMATWAVGILLPMLLQNGLGEKAMLINEILRFVTPVVSILVFIPINAMFMVLIERRALALFTVRKGPNIVGPDGYLQTAADAVKLLFKEDITPIGADAVMFTLAPIVFFAPSIFGAVPLLAAVTNNHALFQVLNLPTGIFYVLAAASVPVVALVMAGWSSNNKYSLVGGLRSAAQAISYEIPLVLSIITICVLAGTLDLVKITEQQAGGILNWNLLGGGALSGIDKYLAAMVSGQPVGSILQASYPFSALSAVATGALICCTIISFWLYLTGACAEINRIPFDLPEAESELVSGYNTEYSGIKFAIFFLAEFTNLFVVSSIATVMFLGGGDNPIPVWILDKLPLLPQLVQALRDSFLVQTLHLINPETLFSTLWVILKVYSLVFFAILIRGTLPRFRIDQLMDFGWKRLIPLSLIVFVIVVFARGLVNCHG